MCHTLTDIYTAALLPTKPSIRWWLWIQAWFRDRNIITIKPKRPSSNSQYHQTLWDWRHSVGLHAVRALSWIFLCIFSCLMEKVQDYIYIYIYICVCVCVKVCECKCVYVRVHWCVRICAYAYAYVYIWVCLCASMYVYVLMFVSLFKGKSTFAGYLMPKPSF